MLKVYADPKLHLRKAEKVRTSMNEVATLAKRVTIKHSLLIYKRH
jgi:hypothetical protein